MERREGQNKEKHLYFETCYVINLASWIFCVMIIKQNHYNTFSDSISN